MAFITEVHCSICGKTKNEVTLHDNKCNKCRAKEASKARRTHLAGLKGLTVEERLEKIEAALYDRRDFDSELYGLAAMNRKYA